MIASAADLVAKISCCNYSLKTSTAVASMVGEAGASAASQSRNGSWLQC